MISLVARDWQVLKGAAGLPEPWTTDGVPPFSRSLCRYVVEDNAPLIVRDARRHPRVKENSATRDLKAIAYLGLPLATPDGVAIGALCAVQNRPRAWSRDEIDDLQGLADLATNTIALRVEIKANKRLIEALRAGEARYRAIVEDQTELICRHKADTTLTFVNGAYCRYFGRSEAELLGTPFLHLIPEKARAGVRDELADLPPNEAVTVEHEVTTPNGKRAWQQWTNRAITDETGAVVEYQCVGRDITRRYEAERKLEELARNDPLTGLLNRRALDATIDRAVRDTGAKGCVTVLVLDLDRFKPINDALGHAMGDDLLRLIAARLRTCVRDGDELFRLGGDEFAVVGNVKHPTAAKAMAARIVEAMGRPFALRDQTVTIGVSVGVALASDGNGSNDLLARADRAMYAAKARGGTRWSAAT